MHSSAPSVWHRGVFLDAIFIIPPQFKVSTTQGAHWWSERRCNNCHLLSSVDPVLYCYTNATHVPTVLSLVSSAASVFASSLGQFMDSALHCLASQSGAFTGVYYCRSFVVVRFIHHALLRALILSILASNAIDQANHHE